MKRYSSIGLVAICLLVGIVYIQQQREVSLERSVEFNIAELSPAGEQVGYAMPASGGSPPDTVPGCAVQVNPQLVESGEKIAISWVHGIIPGESRSGNFIDDKIKDYSNSVGVTVPDHTNILSSLFDSIVAYAGGGGSKPPPDPVVPEMKGILDGLSPWKVQTACLAYCNLDKNKCDPKKPAQWTPIEYQKVAAHTFQNEEWYTPKVAYASSKGNPCNNASATSKGVYFNPGNLSGNYVIGIGAQYMATYGGHHHVMEENGCYATVSINTDARPELIPEILIEDIKFSAGSDVPLEVMIRNIGSGATDHRFDEDGLFNYQIKLDVKNNGFSNGVGGDILFRSGGNTIGPLARQFSIKKPYEVLVSPVWDGADVVLGTHGIQVCVDTQNTVTEIREDNNCARATFKVVSPDIVAGVFSNLTRIYGEILNLPGFAQNISNVPITTTFQNKIEIRGGGNSIVVPANEIRSLSRGGTSWIVSNGINHEVEFPGLRDLEYRVWVDTENDVPEVSPDNVLPNENGNNVTDWVPFTLVDPMVATGTITYLPVSMEVSPVLIRSGEEVEITWDAGGRPDTMCELSPSVQNATGYTSSMTSAAGTTTDNPRNMTIYKITCGTEEASAMVRVLSTIEEN